MPSRQSSALGSAANLNVHFHSLVVAVRVRRRILRLARRHGIDVEGAGIVEGDRRDELAEESPLLAGLAAASVAGRSSIGADAGGRAVRLGHATEVASDDGSDLPRHAHIAGFDLHAGVAVPAGDRARLEHLCRYALRPPIAQDALAIAPDGRVRVEICRSCRDGTRALLFDPIDFLGRLAALTPKPRVNLLLYHGVFAPHVARWRGHGRSPRAVPRRVARDFRHRARPAHRRRLVNRRGLGRSARAAGWGGPTCCGGCSRSTLRFVAAIDDPDVVRRILGHLGLPTSIAPPLPAPPPPGIAQTSFDWA